MIRFSSGYIFISFVNVFVLDFLVVVYRFINVCKLVKKLSGLSVRFVSVNSTLTTFFSHLFQIKLTASVGVFKFVFIVILSFIRQHNY